LKLKEIYAILDKLSPFETQEKWDNSGLIVGSFEDEVKEIVLSIDLDEELIDKFSPNTLFIVHHPLIFGKLNNLDFSKYPSNLIQKLILNRQSVIAMHTNFDKSHLNSYVFSEVLKFNLDYCDEFICATNEEFKFEDLIDRVKKAFNLPLLRVVNKKDNIKGVALTTGAGASLIDLVDVDCYITGDIKYHDAIKAQNQNLMLIEVGHYESERFFANALGNLLKTLNISVIITKSKNPFEIF